MLICNRELLKAARTYYVRTDGNDSNSGLENTAGGAFLTIQKAVDVVYDTLDFGGFDVTIQIGDGTYTAGALINGPQTGRGTFTIQGNATTPSNVVISTTNAHAFKLDRYAVLTLRDLEMRTTSFGTCLQVLSSKVNHSNLVFGPAATFHIQVSFGSTVVAGNYAIKGSAQTHIHVGTGATIWMNAITVTLTGTPNFSASFIYATLCGAAHAQSITFTGSATGSRYHIDSNSAVLTFGAGVNYLPGNAAGSLASGGEYA
jgi:hypothetical protein